MLVHIAAASQECKSSAAVIHLEPPAVTEDQEDLYKNNIYNTRM